MKNGNGENSRKGFCYVILTPKEYSVLKIGNCVMYGCMDKY